MSSDGDAPDEGDESGDETETELAAGDLLERLIMVMSALLIVGILGYLASQAIVTPEAPQPAATVEGVEPFPADDPDTERVQVTVRLVNEGGTGVDSVEVVVHCGGVERSLVFSHVPASGHRTGTVVCPRDTTPRASVVTWVEA